MRKLQFVTMIFALWVITLLLVRSFVCLGWIIPIRVASHSMAPTLCGPHAKTVCQACGHLMRTALASPPRDPTAAINCLNCGHRTALTPKEPPQPGQRVVIDRWSVRRRGLRRFDTVALVDRNSGQASLRTKRILGLPGETIAVFDGNVYANGRVVQKNG